MGDHDYSFNLDREFFLSFESSEIEHGSVHARVVLEKNPGVMTLHFFLHGEVEVTCDRCLGSFMKKLEARHQIHVKTGDAPGEIEDDVIMIGREDHEIDVSQLLYEFTILALPLQRIHPKGSGGELTCDPVMLRKLKEYRKGKMNRESDPDPRWDVLKDMVKK